MQKKDYILKWCTALMLLCAGSSLFAQTQLEKEVLRLFDTPITWLHNYEGQIDEAHSAKLCLAFDGFNCRGYMQYEESKTTFLLEGSLQSGDLVFLEKFENIPNGYYQGTLENENISLEWTSIDDKQSYSSSFDKVSVIQSGQKDLEVTEKGPLNVHSKSSYVDYFTIIKKDIPTLNENFDGEIEKLLSDWNTEIDKSKTKKYRDRFENKAELWFNITELSDKYFSGYINFSSSWNSKIKSLAFSYDREHEKYVRTRDYFKPLEKWEDSIRQKMYKMKHFKEDKGGYENWIADVALLDPVLCDKGIKIKTEKSSVFGQIEGMIPWGSLTSDQISPAKLKKMKR